MADVDVVCPFFEPSHCPPKIFNVQTRKLFTAYIPTPKEALLCYIVKLLEMLYNSVLTH